jgi:hypothetical protein
MLTGSLRRPARQAPPRRQLGFPGALRLAAPWLEWRVHAEKAWSRARFGRSRVVLVLLAACRFWQVALRSMQACSVAAECVCTVEPEALTALSGDGAPGPIPRPQGRSIDRGLVRARLPVEGASGRPSRRPSRDDGENDLDARCAPKLLGAHRVVTKRQRRAARSDIEGQNPSRPFRAANRSVSQRREPRGTGSSRANALRDAVSTGCTGTRL